jgi:hypothetical protein
MIKFKTSKLDILKLCQDQEKAGSKGFTLVGRRGMISFIRADFCRLNPDFAYETPDWTFALGRKADSVNTSPYAVHSIHDSSDEGLVEIVTKNLLAEINEVESGIEYTVLDVEDIKGAQDDEVF